MNNAVLKSISEYETKWKIFQKLPVENNRTAIKYVELYEFLHGNTCRIHVKSDLILSTDKEFVEFGERNLLRIFNMTPKIDPDLASIKFLISKNRLVLKPDIKLVYSDSKFSVSEFTFKVKNTNSVLMHRLEASLFFNPNSSVRFNICNFCLVKSLLLNIAKHKDYIIGSEHTIQLISLYRALLYDVRVDLVKCYFDGIQMKCALFHSVIFHGIYQTGITELTIELPNFILESNYAREGPFRLLIKSKFPPHRSWLPWAISEEFFVIRKNLPESAFFTWLFSYSPTTELLGNSNSAVFEYNIENMCEHLIQSKKVIKYIH